MKTELNKELTSHEDAVNWLTSLYNNSEAYHPDDDAREIAWVGSDGQSQYEPTWKEARLLNERMAECFLYCDPHEVLLNLINPEYDGTE